MPKRANPFGDHTSLQLKTHVREKEVDKGVNQQVRMQSVYDRTQALLFSGMRQLHDSKSVPENCNDVEFIDAELNSKADSSALKQLHLNNKCELINGGTEEEMEAEYRSSPVPLLQLGSSFNGCNASTNNADKGQNSPMASCKASNELRSPCTVPQLNEKHVEKAGSLSCHTCNPFLLMKSAQSKVHSVEKSFLGVRACHNCRLPVQSKDVMKCQFCENYVCYPCVRQCGGCHLHYCQLCSVINYDESFEKAFCLNCNRNRFLQ